VNQEDIEWTDRYLFFFEFNVRVVLCLFFFFYCDRFGDLVISDPRLIGRYLFFDFLGSENSFQAKGEIEEKGNDNRSE
jgi:hypothetical protein